MARLYYYYAILPMVVVVGTAILLVCPFLALIVLAGLLAGLVWGLVSVSKALGRAVERHWRSRFGMAPAAMPARVRR